VAHSLSATISSTLAETSLDESPRRLPPGADSELVGNNSVPKAPMTDSPLKLRPRTPVWCPAGGRLRGVVGARPRGEGDRVAAR